MKRAPVRALEWVGKTTAAAFDALVPAACVGCHRGVSAAGVPLCGLCRSRMPRLPRPRCPRCAEPLGNPYEPGSSVARCGICESWGDALVSADAPFVFEGLAATVVRALKYRGWRSLVPYMAREMGDVVRTVAASLADTGEPPRLVPVPLTAARARERGFNQAEALAAGLARQGYGALAPELVRLPGGGRQAKAGGALRRANVQGRFRAPRSPARPDRVVVIIDDVLTTGSTVLACADALAEAGFRRVATVSFARTLRLLDPSASDDAKGSPRNR